MARHHKENILDNDFLKLLAVLGGAWMGVEILKSFSKKETVYDCPVCKYSIKFGTSQCPNCNSKLEWPNSNENK